MASVEMKGQKRICPPSWWQQLTWRLIRKEKSTKLLLQPLKYRMWHQTLQTYSLHDLGHFLHFQQYVMYSGYIWRTYLCGTLTVGCKKERVFHIITKNTSVLIFSQNSEVLRFSLEQKTESGINFCLRNQATKYPQFCPSQISLWCFWHVIFVLPTSTMLIF